MARRGPRNARVLDGLPGWVTLAYLALVLVALSTIELVFRLSGQTRGSTETLTWAATVLVLSGLGFGLILLRQIASTRRSARALNETRAALRAMNEVLVVPPGPFDLKRLLSQTLERVGQTLQSDAGSIHLADEERHLRPAAAFGDPGLELEHGVLQGVLRTRRSATGVYEGLGDAEGTATWAYLASPLPGGEQSVGVVALGSVGGRTYTDLDANVLELVAERLASAIERDRLVERERRSRLAAERARGLLAMLNESADALAPAVESYDLALGELVDHVVPSFADWFAVDLADEPDGSLRAVAGGGSEDILHLGETASDWNEWREFLAQVMTEGSPHLAYSHRAETVVNRDHPALMSRLGAASYLVVPIRVRGLSFGTLSFLTRTHRRGFRPSDIPPAEALAERVAVTVERVMTYGEVREAGQAARRQATHLRRVSQATLAVSAAPLVEERILDVVADQALLVTGASQAVVTVVDEPAAPRWAASPAPPDDGEQPQANLDKLIRTTNRPMRWIPDAPDADDDRRQAWLAAPLMTAKGDNRGSIVVVRDGESFTPDEEAVLVSLAQLASVALDKLRLYEEVQDGQARLAVLIDSSPVAIVELTTTGEPIRWNRTTQELLGWPESPAAAGFVGGTTEDPQGRFAEIWQRTAQGETVGATDGIVQRPDGSTIDVSVATAPLRSADGRVGAVLAVMEDISARRRMDEQISRAGRMDAMGRLAGAVAHDFNNLLTVILGYNNLLSDQLADTPMAADIAAVGSAAQRAAQLTNQLLDIGRQQVTTPRPVDVREFLTTLEPVLERLVGTSSTLELDLQDDLHIFIDPSQLERVVLNLVLNSADAMPEGGSLLIAADRMEGEESALEEGDYVRLAIRDTGSGMDAFALEHCFDPFFTTKDRSKGTGLGLAAVYGIVTQSGGLINVDSELGVGTTLTMIFPAVTPEGAEPDARPRSSARVSGVERILLVEDQDDVRRLLSEELARNGYAVVDVPSGPAALFTADEEGPFDLLVTDVIMPGMSGTELARKLAPTGVPVLFVSGHVDDALRRDLDPDADLLSKPFTPQVLVERVRRALDRAAPQGSKR